MGVSEELQGLTLKGKNDEWKIISRVPRTEERRGGSCSIGYLGKRLRDGQRAFIKATDVELMTEDADSALERMQVTLAMFQNEWKLLEKCRGNSMDRVVTALDIGHGLITNSASVQQTVLWIAMEWAETDTRAYRGRISAYDFDWTANAMHNVATGVRQLHAADIAHNDLKPSNVLMFGDLVQKIGDLGSAVMPGRIDLHELQDCLGDPRYAAPELVYGDTGIRDYKNRKKNDLFLLGSLGFYFVTNTMLTPHMASYMLPKHRPTDEGGSWNDGFASVLPFLREAHRESMEFLSATMPIGLKVGARNKDYGAEFVAAITQLTDPDPAQRGHPDERRFGVTGTSVERYVSLFDRLRSVAKMLQ